MWGRNVYDGIRKFLQFQLTVNIAAVTIAFIGSVTAAESPLSAVQMLWVNLIMDSFAALALATETPTPSLLDRPPNGLGEPLINNKMWRMIIGQAIFQIAFLLIILYGYDSMSDVFPRTDHPDAKLIQHCIIFNSFVFAQVFNEINCRKLDDDLNVFAGFFTNPLFLTIIILTIVVQALLVEFSGDFANCVPLTGVEWLICLGIGVLSLPIGFLLRFIPVPATRVSKPEEELPLLPETTTMTVIHSKWRIARRILKEIRVIRAFRRHHR